MINVIRKMILYAYFVKKNYMQNIIDEGAKEFTINLVALPIILIFANILTYLYFSHNNPLLENIFLLAGIVFGSCFLVKLLCNEDEIYHEINNNFNSFDKKKKFKITYIVYLLDFLTLSSLLVLLYIYSNN